jgi:acetyltransferase-like isoleucine patch superfamily enzyme
VCKHGLDVGEYIYIGSNVTIYRRNDAGNIIIGDRVYLNESITIEAGFGGSLEIGEETHIQPGCQFSAYTGIIKIGRRVQIAPRCAFYPYDHGIARDKSMMDQPLVSRGGITVGDGVWIGYGAIILDGVTIGSGAVIGAGSVVKRDIPDYCCEEGYP